MELKKYKLGDVVDKFISGDWGDEQISTEAPNEVYCIRGADITPISNSDFDNIPKRYVSDRTLAVKLLKEGNLIIEKSGGSPTQSTGRIAYISKDLVEKKQKIVCSNFCTAIQIKPNWNPLYVYYYWLYMYNNDVFFNFEGKTSGIKNLQIDNALSAIEIEYIPIEKQNKIVSILSSIDQKIALNRAINDNLEAMAKQLYDYWFVQFDFPNEDGKPYKSSGGKMVWNNKLKRDIPEGWNSNKLGELIEELESGKRPKGGIDKNLKEGIPSIGAEAISNLGDFDFSKTPYIPYGTKITSGIVRDNDILVYKDGAYVGKTTLYRDGFPYKFTTINEHVFLMRSIDPKMQEYLFFTLQKGYIFDIMQNLGKAKAAQPGLNQEDLKGIEILFPSKELVCRFRETTEPLMARIFNNSKQIERLTKQRDELLPLLMNGQVSPLNSD